MNSVHTSPLNQETRYVNAIQSNTHIYRIYRISDIQVTICFLPHPLCHVESVRSPVLSVICFITRHSSLSSRSNVRSPGGKRHLGRLEWAKSITTIWWNVAKTGSNHVKPNPATDESRDFPWFSMIFWCNNSTKFSWPAKAWSAKAHDDDSSHWMALHSSGWLHWSMTLATCLSPSKVLCAADMFSMSPFSRYSVQMSYIILWGQLQIEQTRYWGACKMHHLYTTLTKCPVYLLRSWGGKPGTGATGSSLTMIHAWGEPAVCRDLWGSSVPMMWVWEDLKILIEWDIMRQGDTRVVVFLRCRLRTMVKECWRWQMDVIMVVAIIMAIITISMFCLGAKVLSKLFSTGDNIWGLSRFSRSVLDLPIDKEKKSPLKRVKLNQTNNQT